jgi:hypothetical protein
MGTLANYFRLKMIFTIPMFFGINSGLEGQEEKLKDF